MTTMTGSGWLQCDGVERGMFSDEVAVVIPRRDGTTESYFVAATDVRDNRLRVSLLDKCGVLWARLPTNEPVTIPVSKSRIQMK